MDLMSTVDDERTVGPRPGVRWVRLRGLGGLELMHAHFVRHAFARHSHETFAIGVVHAGVEEIRFRDGVERVSPGGLVLINPEVPHTGAGLGDQGWAYRVLYPAPALLAEFAGNRGTPRFPERVVYDRRVADLLIAAHVAAETEDALTGETRMRLALASLLRIYGSAPAVEPEPAAGRSVLQRVRDILHERLVDPPGLDELAEAAEMGPFALVRSFRTSYGLPPHAYLTQLRVRTAQRLLRAGLPAAEVAPMVGFFDQAHLTRHFRRIVGLPPGAYQRGCKNVQA